MVIVFKKEEWVKDTLRLDDGVEIYNVPMLKKGIDREIPNEAKGIDAFVKRHNIESMDWQDWLDILEEGIIEWEKNMNIIMI